MAHDFNSGFTGVDKDMGSRKGWYIAGSILVAGALLATVALRQQQFTVSPQAPQAEPKAVYTAVRTAAVRRGSIAQVLSYTGDVKAKTQVTVIPKAAGRIQGLEVDVGDKVQAGQRLATLEHDVLDAQVQQAMAGLALAKAKLAGLEDGPRAETVAQAEANVRLAESRLAALKAGATPAQVEGAQAAVRAANNQVYAVQAQADSLLSRMGTGYTQEMKSAQTGVAYEQVKQAEAQLAALMAPPTKENLDQAEASVDAARQQLALAQNPYTENDLGAARASVAQAEASV
ncbi:MAG: biotin/lipoyl-binding protein, partial [Dehalococcoidia bacterium]|nr:biotin/lipoyl-binding protein [Dehalococcoidia bacterium]